MFITFNNPFPVQALLNKNDIQTSHSYKVITALAIKTLNGEISGVVEVFTDMENETLFYKLDKNKLNVLKNAYANENGDNEEQKNDILAVVLTDIVKQPRQHQLQSLIFPISGISMEKQIEVIKKNMKKVTELNDILEWDSVIIPGAKGIVGVTYIKS